MISRIGYNPYAAYNSLIQNSEAATGSRKTYNSPATTEQNSLVSTMNRLQTSMKNIRGEFSALGQQATALKTGQTGNAFAKSTVTTGSATAVTATATENATIAKYAVGVTQVAQAQENQGDKLDAFAQNALQAGRQTFDIVANNKTTTVAVDVRSGETNMAVLDKMAMAINGAKTGVTAKVVDETANGQTTSQIVITANQTGAPHGFRLENGSSDLLTKTDAGHETKAAQNARYRVNGKDQESQVNQIQLDNGKVALNLNGATAPDGTVTVAVQRDAKAIQTQVTAFVDQYNKTVNQLADIGVNKNLRSLTLFADSNKFRLADVGLTVNQDKTISMDQDKLDSALKKNFEATKNLIGGTGSLAAWASDKARAAGSSSALPVEATSSNEGTLRDFRNRMMLQQLNQYSQIDNSGRFASGFGGVTAFNFFL